MYLAAKISQNGSDCVNASGNIAGELEQTPCGRSCGVERRTPLHFGSGVQPSDWLVAPFRFADGSCSGLKDQLFIPQRQLRCLRCRFDAYRVERTSFRAGVTPPLKSSTFHGAVLRNYREIVWLAGSVPRGQLILGFLKALSEPERRECCLTLWCPRRLP